MEKIAPTRGYRHFGYTGMTGDAIL